MKTFIIGDVHGNIQALAKMMKMIKMEGTENKIIMVGDYIDRGKNSYNVVKYLQSLQKKYGERVICLMGNHENLAVDYLSAIKKRGYANYSDTAIYFQNGGAITLESYEKAGKNMMDDYDWFKNLPLYYEGKNFIAVHAGLRGGFELKNQMENDLLWIREDFHDLPEGTFEKSVVFGHTITGFLEENNEHTPVVINGNIAIDTGAVFTGILTAVVIKDEYEVVDFIQTR